MVFQLIISNVSWKIYEAQSRYDIFLNATQITFPLMFVLIRKTWHLIENKNCLEKSFYVLLVFVGFVKYPVYTINNILRNVWINKTLTFIPKAVVSFNSILIFYGYFGISMWFLFFFLSTYNILREVNSKYWWHKIKSEESEKKRFPFWTSVKVERC